MPPITVTSIERLKALGRKLRLVWIQVGVALLIVLLIDAAAIVILHSQPQKDRRAFADAYHGATWTPEYFDEYASIKVRWQPYAYWVGDKYAGKYINVDTAGFRRTYKSQSPDCDRLARVFTWV